MTTTAHVTSTIDYLPADLLTVDPQVQRQEGADARRVGSMSSDFDPMALGLLIVSRRADGTHVILDGMHRWSAARAAGYNAPLPCRVFTGLTTADEAALFLRYNTKKDPSKLSKFRARVLTGEKQAVTIDGIVRAAGWEVAKNGNPGAGRIYAADVLDRIYTTAAGAKPRGEYPDVLAHVLVAVTSAWGSDHEGANGHILAGLAQVFGRFGDAVDVGKLVAEMKQTTPGALVGRGKALRDYQGGTVPAAIAKHLVGRVNNRRRTNLLPEWVWTR